MQEEEVFGIIILSVSLCCGDNLLEHLFLYATDVEDAQGIWFFLYTCQSLFLFFAFPQQFDCISMVFRQQFVKSGSAEMRETAAEAAPERERYMKITYIHHSAFLAETDRAALLFDYFKGEIPEIPEEKVLYVFASHAHGDHFSEIIFTLAEKHPNLRYILSADIPAERVPENLKEKTVFLDPDEQWSDDVMTVETFRSTDEGVAFWCRTDGIDLYHAGDLNHWYWEGEDEQWNRDMTAAYRAEIGKMHGRRADVAFLPLDPRLEQWFYLGIDDWMKEADAAVIMPMHFWGQFDVTARLKELPCSEGYRDRLTEIVKEGQVFDLSGR